MRVLLSGANLPLSEAESFPEDDIDRLFGKLRKLEPPGDIVKQILARVKRLPTPRPLPPTDVEHPPLEERQEATD